MSRRGPKLTNSIHINTLTDILIPPLVHPILYGTKTNVRKVSPRKFVIGFSPITLSSFLPQDRLRIPSVLRLGLSFGVRTHKRVRQHDVTWLLVNEGIFSGVLNH